MKLCPAILLICLTVIGAAVGRAQANVAVSWPHSKSAGIAGYRLVYGDGTNWVTLDTGYVTQAAVTNLIYGRTYFFLIASVASNGATSGTSPIVTRLILPAAPELTRDKALLTCGPFILEATTNQQTWTPVQTNYVWFEQSATNPAMSFRMRSPGLPMQIQLQP